MRRARVTAVRAYKAVQGGILKQSLTSTWNDGDSIAVEAATHFSRNGGEAVINPRLDADGSQLGELISYSGIEITASDDPAAPDYLTGVIRANPVAHASKTFIQEGETPTLEKQIDGYPDGSDELVSGIPVRQTVYTLVKLGDYAEDEMPVVPVDIEDDGQWFVTDGPVGSVPQIDEDLEALPPVGGGDASLSITQPDGTVLPPKGMGYEDGEAPSTDVVPVVVGGIKALFVRFDTIANNSQVTYKAHVHTTSGFTPDATTQVGTIELAGTPDFTAVIPVSDFPTGHVLDGTAADPPKAGTTYYAKVVPADGSGDFAGPYSEASGTPVAIGSDDIGALAITSTHIADDSISTPKLQANAVTSNEIAALTIVGGDIAGTTITGSKISGTTITADKLSVSSLSAISADIGSVTAGSITGVTITGGSVSTSSGSDRISLSGLSPGTISFRTASDGGFAGAITGSGTTLSLTAPGGTTQNITLNGYPNFTITGTASGGILGYIAVKVSGTERRIPFYAT